MAVGFTPKHTETISINGLTQQQFIALANETAIKIEWKVAYMSTHGLIAYTDYGMFSRNAEIKITLEGASAEIQSASTGSEMADWGKNKENVAYFIQTLETLKQTLSVEELDTKYQTLTEQLVPEEEDILKLPPPTTTEKISGFFSIFKPQEGFFITPILIDLNILIFIIMAFSGVNIM
ncbi:MAG TPA: hypothetical protein VL092_10770, partial [Chitinophagaceae bacterium]|nr:hypothetical protein [Chitinophagaceae bacterium]